MAGIKEYAEKELDLYLPVKEGEDELDKHIREGIRKDVMELIDVFEKQSHSGMTANIILSIFDRLVHYKPITKLTGEDSEWQEVDEGSYQNIRCSSVFKDKDTGMAYDINGKVFSDDGGETYHITSNSRTYISFPYNPPTKPKKVILKKGNGKNGKKENK